MPPPAVADSTLPPLADNSLPPSPGASNNPLPSLDNTGLPPAPVAQVPDNGNSLPPLDNGIASQPPGLDNNLNTLPPGSAAPPPLDQAALPPGLPGAPDSTVPAIVSNGNVPTASASHASELGLPAVPSNVVKSGYLQDVPTL